MKKIRFTALCLALALSAGLLAGCGNPAENSFDAVTTNNSSMDNVLEANDAALTDTLEQVSDTSTTVESSTESSADESEESTEESSQISDESEPAEEISVDESEEQSEQSKEPSKNDETGKRNPSNTGSSHKHSYRETANVGPTCMENGYILFTCSCGDNFKYDKPGLGSHDFLSNPDVYIEPTETTRGKLVATCAYGCGTSVSEEYYSLNEVNEMLRPRVLYWIEYYRKQAGVSEITISEVFNRYAQYRATQLVTNYAHDWEDQKAAAAATHVGTHYESAKACPDTGWHPQCGEIISSGYGPRAAKFSTTDDSVPESIEFYAKEIVNAFYNSPRHKDIMLSERVEKQVIGIGIHKGYVCITFTIEYHEETYDYWYENSEGDLYHAWVSYETGYFSDDGKNFIYPPSEKYNEVFFIAKAEDCDWF